MPLEVIAVGDFKGGFPTRFPIKASVDCWSHRNGIAIIIRKRF